MKWRKVLWRCELQNILLQILSSKAMTAVEAVVLLRTMGITIDVQALSSILNATDGIYIAGQVCSAYSRRMVNLYKSCDILFREGLRELGGF